MRLPVSLESVHEDDVTQHTSKITLDLSFATSLAGLIATAVWVTLAVESSGVGWLWGQRIIDWLMVVVWLRQGDKLP